MKLLLKVVAGASSVADTTHFHSVTAKEICQTPLKHKNTAVPTLL
jgi:hypothetical protein